MAQIEEKQDNQNSKSHTLEPKEDEYQNWDDDVKIKYAYTSEDLLRNMDGFAVALPWIEMRKNDGYLPVLYNEKRCIVETPVSICLFGLETYTNPDSRIKKYSINFNIKSEGDKEMEKFMLVINQLDDFVQQYKVNEKEKFQKSFQIQRRNKTPCMRIKIPSYKKQLNIKLIVGKDTIEYPSTDEFKAYIQFQTRVSLVILINNIWRAAGRYGISYKLLKVRVHDDPYDVQFRN
jgi:hypothetical protein